METDRILRARIELEAKSTIGYSEAENKESFLVGVCVALSLVEGHYGKEIVKLQNQVNGYRVSSESYLADLKTLSSIVSHYSDDEM